MRMQISASSPVRVLVDSASSSYAPRMVWATWELTPRVFSKSTFSFTIWAMEAVDRSSSPLNRAELTVSTAMRGILYEMFWRQRQTSRRAGSRMNGKAMIAASRKGSKPKGFIGSMPKTNGNQTAKIRQFFWLAPDNHIILHHCQMNHAARSAKQPDLNVERVARVEAPWISIFNFWRLWTLSPSALASRWFWWSCAWPKWLFGAKRVWLNQTSFLGRQRRFHSIASSLFVPLFTDWNFISGTFFHTISSITWRHQVVADSR